MAFLDYYKILGVDKKATGDEIKKAYRKMARKYHPDLNPDDPQAEKRFREINEANEVLSDTENRKKYDQHGSDWKHSEQFEKQRQQQSQRNTRQNASSGFSGNNYSDFFESMFGGGERNSAAYKGQDYQTELNLDLTDVFATHKRTLNIAGKNIRLTIPAGVKDGQVIKIKGQGGVGINGGPNGDLLIRFSIENHSRFTLKGDNLMSEVKIGLYLAMLGGEITVDTFDGKVKLKVKPETQNGTKVKLKGKGFPIYKKEGQFGDLYITYHVEFPRELTDKEKELFQELSNLRSL